MSFAIQHSTLRDLYDKVVAGERLSEADALRLLESKDINAVGAIADFARQRKVGNRASYILNRYINYSNYCIKGSPISVSGQAGKRISGSQPFFS